MCGIAWPTHFHTVVTAALIQFARATPLATGLKFGRRTVLALIGLAAVTAVLATGWALLPIRELLTASPAGQHQHHRSALGGTHPRAVGHRW
jgi:hypothetical protein